MNDVRRKIYGSYLHETMDFLADLKRQQWRKWFDAPIPMIGNRTPRQAAQTPEGRRDLDDLFQFYDSQRGAVSGSVDVNVPTRWAKWKLGYGPGRSEEFAEEESIFNKQEEKQATQRNEKHAKRLDKRINSIYIPLRCEVVGCTKRGADVQKCTRCQCAWYVLL